MVGSEVMRRKRKGPGTATGAGTFEGCVASNTSAGGRKSNQDASLAVAINPRENAWGLSALIAVADGLGGHRAGDVASGMAISTLKGIFVDGDIDNLDGIALGEDPARYLKEVFSLINKRIISSDDSPVEGRGMGTTLTVALVFEDGEVVVGHVGDSRLYRVRGDEALQMTMDHSPVGRLLARSIITEREAAQREDRNVVDRALGFEASLAVDILELVLQADDVIVLTTDGFSNVVFSDEMPAIIRKHSGAKDVSGNLLWTALARQTSDNATVAVLLVPDPEGVGHAGLCVNEKVETDTPGESEAGFPHKDVPCPVGGGGGIKDMGNSRDPCVCCGRKGLTDESVQRTRQVACPD